MKNTLLTIAVLAFLMTVATAAYAEDTVSYEAKTTAVTVLGDRAEIVATAEVELVNGYQAIPIKPIPSQADISSLRVKILANGETTLQAVKISSIAVAQPPLEKYNELVARMKKLRGEITEQSDYLSVLTAKMNLANNLMLTSQKMIAISLSLGRPLPPEITGKIAFLSSQQVEMRQLQIGIEQILKEKRAELEALSRELAASYGNQRKRETVAIVELYSQVAGKAKIEIKYFVSNCWWRPDYDFNLLPGGSEVEFSYNAVVYQGTGLDWSDVDLTLATSSPSMQLVPPKPESWWVMQYIEPSLALGVAAGYPRRVAEKSKKMNRNAEKEEAEMELDELNELAAEVAQATAVASGGLAVSFAIPGKSSMATGSQKKFLITTSKLSSEVKRYIVARVNPVAYIRAITKNSTDFPLLPGVARCYVEGALTGRTNIARIMPGAELKLPIGYENRLKVEYKELPHVRDDKGKKVRETFKYRIEITNSANIPLPIELLDQIPVSDNDDLKVSDPKFSIKPDKSNDEGILTWTRTVAAGEKLVIEIEYYLEYPTEATVYSE